MGQHVVELNFQSDSFGSWASFVVLTKFLKKIRLFLAIFLKKIANLLGVFLKQYKNGKFVNRISDTF